MPCDTSVNFHHHKDDGPQPDNNNIPEIIDVFANIKLKYPKYLFACLNYK